MQKKPFALSHTRDKTSFLFLYQAPKPTIFLILFTNMRLSTSLIDYVGHLSYMNFIAVEHRSAESKGLRLESSWGLTIVSLSHARGKTKNIFLYFFTKLKTYYIPHSIYFRITWTFD